MGGCCPRRATWSWPTPDDLQEDKDIEWWHYERLLWACGDRWPKADPSQAAPSQAAPSQAAPSQAAPSQASDVMNSLTLRRAMRPTTSPGHASGYQPGSIASPLAANSQSSCIAFESAAEDGMRSLHYVSLNIGEGARAASKGF